MFSTDVIHPWAFVIYKFLRALVTSKGVNRILISFFLYLDLFSIFVELVFEEGCYNFYLLLWVWCLAMLSFNKQFFLAILSINLLISFFSMFRDILSDVDSISFRIFFSVLKIVLPILLFFLCLIYQVWGWWFCCKLSSIYLVVFHLLLCIDGAVHWFSLCMLLLCSLAEVAIFLVRFLDCWILLHTI